MSSILSKMRKVQYTTRDKVASSLTIDNTVYNALNCKIGNADEWCKFKANEVRDLLEEEALELREQGMLSKINKSGEVVDIEVSEYICGKVSSGVRMAAYLEVIDQRYL